MIENDKNTNDKEQKGQPTPTNPSEPEKTIQHNPKENQEQKDNSEQQQEHSVEQTIENYEHKTDQPAKQTEISKLKKSPPPSPSSEAAPRLEHKASSSATFSDEEEEQENDDEADEFHGIPVKAYDEMNIDALAEELGRLLKAHKVKEIRAHAQEIKMEFDTKFGKERADKKEAFIADGGNIVDFSYSTTAEKKFNKIYFAYKEKRDHYYKDVRKNLQDNLEQRLSIIEELKAITGVGTDMNANFKTFKKLQSRWRKAGPVPRNDYKDTWKTYHHYVERFYDFLHLDREFREMDYKHNLEQKLKMIDRAEELAQDSDINRAFRELQNLHRMWKEEVGPVAEKYSEDIWEKFSTATKKIHDNRKVYFAEREQEREKNLALKKEIIASIQALKKEKITSHGQAQKKIKKHQRLRDRFFNTGKVPRKNNQEIWEAFKEVSREFNHEKNEFYKQRKQEQKENLEKKLALIKIAEEHQNSDDFKEVTPLMKKIQSDWKKIGYIPRSKSNKMWKHFKRACNHYFDRLHAQQDNREKAALEVFHKKTALLKEVQDYSLSGDQEQDLVKIKDKIETWKELGRVPKHKKKIEHQFNDALDKLFTQLGLNRTEAEMLKYENHLQQLKETEDENKLWKETNFLHKKTAQTKDEIRQLETNLEFFDNVDKDNPLMKDTFKKMDRLKQQLKTWEAKLDKVKHL